MVINIKLPIDLVKLRKTFVISAKGVKVKVTRKHVFLFYILDQICFFRIQAETRLMSDVGEGKLDKNGFLLYICRFEGFSATFLILSSIKTRIHRS